MAQTKKPTWEKSSAGLVDMFQALVPQEKSVEQKKMFGWPCCFVNGNLFMGLHKQSMIFRLADADRTEFLKLDGAGDFQPMPGRTMKGYVALTDPLRTKPADLKPWVQRSLSHTRTLPPKSKKRD